jgi:hypothetical protein
VSFGSCPPELSTAQRLHSGRSIALGLAACSCIISIFCALQPPAVQGLNFLSTFMLLFLAFSREFLHPCPSASPAVKSLHFRCSQHLSGSFLRPRADCYATV